MKIETTILNRAKKYFVLASAFIFFLTVLSFVTQQGPWKAPASADQKKNPLASNEQSIAAGRTLFMKDCATCHGKKGKGDGPSAAALGVDFTDFASASFQGQSDGALFWKISEGRKPMPSFKKQYQEQQIWQVVNFIRTLKK
ncbi:MAG: c-type cytochrome [Cytophagaceae bacterium]|nr:c-type cytochrome [Cytophagaceae bacterium]